MGALEQGRDQCQDRGRDEDQTRTGTETGTAIRIRPRPGPESGSGSLWDRGRGRDQAGPRAGARSGVSVPRSRGGVPVPRPQPRRPPSSGCPSPLSRCASTGTGGSRRAPRAAPAGREHRAPLPPGTESTGRRSPCSGRARRHGDFPGQAHGSRAQKSPSRSGRPLCPRDPQGPFVLPSESFLGSDIGPGNPEHSVPNSRCGLSFFPGAAVTWPRPVVALRLRLGPRPCVLSGIAAVRAVRAGRAGLAG